MAKARRPPAERFLGYPRGGGASVFPATGGDDLPDLAEADLWYSEGAGPAPADEAGISRYREAREEEGERMTATAGGRRAPRRVAVGGLSRAFGDDGRQLQQAAAASAPVAVPAWPWPSRFAAETETLAESRKEEEEDAEGSTTTDGGWVAPHVYLARRQARASVVEGAGRTLKGRDMSRVRDAVWSRTGFDG